MADRGPGADFKYYDETIRAQAEIIATLLTVCTQNTNDAKKAIAALENSRTRLTEDVSTLTANVQAAIAQSADDTATRAAKLLQEKFMQADAAADAAARRYLQAGRWLGTKTFLLLLSCLAAIALAGWLIAAPLLPTFEELQKRRDDVASLTAHAEGLAKKGVNLEWTYCRDHNQPKTMCFRTDGKGYIDPKSGATYASPYHAKR